MKYREARNEIANLISHNKDDLGRTIISGLITDFLSWHENEVKKLQQHSMQAEVSDVSEGAAVASEGEGEANTCAGYGSCKGLDKWCACKYAEHFTKEKRA